MTHRCVDASVIVKVALKGEPYRARAQQLVYDSMAAGISLIAPPFFPYEVDTAIRRRVFSGQLNQADARKAFRVLDRTPVQIVTHPLLRQRTRHLADRFNQRTVYDASYAALAELHSCEFWTADKLFL